MPGVSVTHVLPRVSSLSRLCLGAVALLWLGTVALLPGAAWGQAIAEGTDSTETDAVGRLVYFEGKVGVQTDGEWAPAQIDQSLRPPDRLATGPNAKAEIKWSSGGRSTLGAADTQRVGRLYAQAQADAPEEAASLLDRFKELFVKKTEAADDPAALRRGAGTSFEQAIMLYRQNQYQQALPLFQRFLDRETNPAAVQESKAALARFALAHCYLDAGRRTDARSTLQSLIETHPESRPAELARALLEIL